MKTGIALIDIRSVLQVLVEILLINRQGLRHRNLAGKLAIRRKMATLKL